MVTINLTAIGTEQELIKKYFTENASDSLTDKINNGVRIEKDGKTLISKKTLDGFMKYANEEARKLASKGATSACVEDKVVYSWAIHYFEEDSIEGTLYNEDGTEYKPPKPVKAKQAIPASIPNKTSITASKEPVGQLSLFDFTDSTDVPSEDIADVEEIEESVNETQERVTVHVPQPNGSDLCIDTETGEVIEEPQNTTEELIAILFNILQEDLEVQL
jgi:hypothetical protein